MEQVSALDLVGCPRVECGLLHTDSYEQGKKGVGVCAVNVVFLWDWS